MIPTAHHTQKLVQDVSQTNMKAKTVKKLQENIFMTLEWVKLINKSDIKSNDNERKIIYWTS